MTGVRPSSDGPLAAGLAALGMVVVTGAGALSALLECTLVPLYSGTVVVPVSVVLAVALNVLLPYLGRTMVPRSLAAAAPFVAWLVVVIAFGAVARPEGDVILPGGGVGGVEYYTYAMLLGGALAGAVTLVFVNTPRQRVTAGPGERDLTRRDPGTRRDAGKRRGVSR